MRGKTHLAAFLFSLAATSQAKAETSSLKLPQTETAQGISVIQNPAEDSFKPAQVYGQVRLESMQYMTPLPDS
ncbi:MAG TPA: hypothetical protein VN132_07440, partial [Bdellovibrio sp.]|nr:hypothetical protein [Bdellovibrio sp.]